MKKRNPAILTKEDWERVEWWLKLTPQAKQGACPWGTRVQQQGGKCAALFPKITPKFRGSYTCQYKCPCHSYSIEYVVRVAKQLLLQKRGE